jgi:hypothetical protein
MASRTPTPADHNARAVAAVAGVEPPRLVLEQHGRASWAGNPVGCRRGLADRARSAFSRNAKIRTQAVNRARELGCCGSRRPPAQPAAR